MADWMDLAQDALAAGRAIQRQHARSSVSRYYYAVYSAMSFALARTPGIRFATGREGPSHEALPRLADHLRMDKRARKRLKHVLRTLYYARLDADYRPSRQVAFGESWRAARDTSTALRILQGERP